MASHLESWLDTACKALDLKLEYLTAEQKIALYQACATEMVAQAIDQAVDANRIDAGLVERTLRGELDG